MEVSIEVCEGSEMTKILIREIIIDLIYKTILVLSPVSEYPNNTLIDLKLS